MKFKIVGQIILIIHQIQSFKGILLIVSLFVLLHNHIN